jgi:hypothetical protein
MSKRETAKFISEIQKGSFATIPFEPVTLLKEPPKNDEEINEAIEKFYSKTLTEAVRKKIVAKIAVNWPEDPTTAFNPTLVRTYLYRISSAKYVMFSLVVHK